jgi:hypothetical protein
MYLAYALQTPTFNSTHKSQFYKTWFNATQPLVSANGVPPPEHRTEKSYDH